MITGKQAGFGQASGKRPPRRDPEGGYDMKKTVISLLLVFAVLFSFCSACFAEADPLPEFSTFGEAVYAAGENPVTGGNHDYMAVIVEKDGKYYRVVTTLDDCAKELDDAISEAEDITAAFEAYYAYVYTLPVSSVEQITAQPKDQAELNACAGKTIADLEAAGYQTTSSGTWGEPDLIVFEMTDGLFRYEFEVDADFDTYSEKQDKDELETLVVRSGKFAGVSSTAANLRYHADGTVEPEEEDPFGAATAWLGKMLEAFQKAESPEGIDWDSLLTSLTEEFPEDAEQIREALEGYRSLYENAVTQSPEN